MKEGLRFQCVNHYTNLPVSYPLISWLPTYPTNKLTWLADAELLGKIHVLCIHSSPHVLDESSAMDTGT